MATQELEKATTAVPALIRTPALEIDAEDVTLPKLKLGQYTADAVKAQLVKPGSLYTTTGPDDPEPVILLAPEGKSKDTQGQDGVVFYVLGMTKHWFLSEEGSADFETWDFNDPNRPENAWLTFVYTIAIPAVDEAVPFVYVMTKSAKPSAKQINTALVKSGRPPWHTAFVLTTKHKQKNNNEWFIPIVTTTATSDDDIQVAERLAVMVSGKTAEFQATGEEPAI